MCRNGKTFFSVRRRTSIGLLKNSSKNIRFRSFRCFKVAHFYNTIESEMIPSQQPMLIDLAKTFERLIRETKSTSSKKGSNEHDVRITWENPDQLSRYIATLRNAAENLKKENLKLRRIHSNIEQIVCSLINTDLLREREKWNEQIDEIRRMMENLQNDGYAVENFKSWRSFWDRQLFKALEIQYEIGLRTFNESLTEIHVDLIFNENKFEFQMKNSTFDFPTLKQIYFDQMKLFVCFPLNFTGCRTSSNRKLIFSSIFNRHNDEIVRCYENSTDLFKRLTRGIDEYRSWFVLSQLDFDDLLENHLNDVSDWEKNFRILKLKSQDVEKLPS